MSVPTQDAEVRAALRARGQPQTFFAEGPYERRERLKSLIGKSVASITTVVQTGPSAVGDAAEQLFFTEGPATLKDARLFVAKYSIPKSHARLAAYREKFQDEDAQMAEAARRQYNISFGKKLAVVSSKQGDVRPISCGSFSADSRYLATGSFSSNVAIWDVNPEKRRSKDEDNQPGQQIGAKVATIYGVNNDRLHGLAWHPEWKDQGTGSQRLAMATGDAAGTVALWQWGGCDDSERADEGMAETPGTSPPSVSRGQLAGDNTPTCLAQLIGHEEGIRRVDFHPSGKFLASASTDETWRWWDLETQTELLLQEGHSRGVYAVKHHPDGSILISTDLGGVIRGWDLRTGRGIFTFLGHTKAVLAVDFHPISSHIVASGSVDQQVRLWDLRKRDCFEFIGGHTHLVSQVKFEPREGRYLLTSSYDRTARLWSTDDYKCFRVLPGHESYIMGADVANDLSTIATWGYDRTFKLWKMEEKLEQATSVNSMAD